MILIKTFSILRNDTSRSIYGSMYKILANADVSLYRSMLKTNIREHVMWQLEE